MEKDSINGYSAFSGTEDAALSSTAYSLPELTASGYARVDEHSLFADICSKYDSLNLAQSYSSFNATHGYGSFSPEKSGSPYSELTSTFSAIRMYELLPSESPESAYSAPDANFVSQPEPSLQQTQHKESSEGNYPGRGQLIQSAMPSTARDWNAEFQNLFEFTREKISRQGVDPLQGLLHARALSKFVADFTATATAIGEVILSEMFLPLEKRTYRPIDAGGVAGGLKYLQNNIFFKVACDAFKIYGDDHFAQKAAQKEIGSMMALLAETTYGDYERVENVSLAFPLVTLISYRGYTLMASSRLPIASSSKKGKSLVYGSDDGGSTVYASVPEVNEAMRNLLEKCLHLKGHYAGTNRGDRSKLTFLHGPADIEVHRGSDGRYYILDTARVFPPCVPDRTLKVSHLYRMLRPELLRKQNKKLSADAFSNFGHDNAKEHNDEVRSVTRWLLEEVIPEFAKWWEDHNANRAVPYDTDSAKLLVADMHLRGINVRLLGRLLAHLNSEKLRRFVAKEMIARMLRTEIHSKVRLLASSDQPTIISLYADLLNLLFGPNSEKFWSAPMIAGLQLHWSLSAGGSDEQIVSEIQKSVSDRKEILFRVATLLGLELSFGTSNVEDLIQSGGIDPSHIVQLRSIVRPMHIFSFMEGLAGVDYADTKDGAEALEAFKEAADFYSRALRLFPGESKAFNNHAVALLRYCQLRTSGGYDQEDTAELLERACDDFARSWWLGQHVGRPHLTLLSWGIVYREIARLSVTSPARRLQCYEQAAAKLREALVIEKNDTWATRDNLGLVLFNHGVELARQQCEDHALITRKFEEAYAEFESSAADPKSDGSAGINLGLALYNQVAACESFLPPTEVTAILERCFATFQKTIDDPRLAKHKLAVVVGNYTMAVMQNLDRHPEEKQIGKLSELSALCDRAFEADPSFWKAIYNHCSVYQKLANLDLPNRSKHLAHAKKCCERTLAVYPQFKDAYSKLHLILRDMTDVLQASIARGGIEQVAVCNNLFLEAIRVAEEWHRIDSKSIEPLFLIAHDIVARAYLPCNVEAMPLLLEEAESKFIVAMMHDLENLSQPTEKSAELLSRVSALRLPKDSNPAVASLHNSDRYPIGTSALFLSSPVSQLAVRASLLSGLVSLSREPLQQRALHQNGASAAIKAMGFLQSNSPPLHRLHSARLLANLCTNPQNRLEIFDLGLLDDLAMALVTPGQSIEIALAAIRAVANLSLSDRPEAVASHVGVLRGVLSNAANQTTAALSAHTLKFLTAPRNVAQIVIAAEPYEALASLASIQEAASSLIITLEQLCDVDYEKVVRGFVKLVRETQDPQLVQDAIRVLRLLAGQGTRAPIFLRCDEGLSAFDAMSSDPAAPVGARYHSVCGIHNLLSATSLSWNCDSCSQSIETKRYRCSECEDFDYCQDCFEKKVEKANHKSTHRMYQFPEQFDHESYGTLLSIQVPPILDRFAKDSENAVATLARRLLQMLPAKETHKTQ